MNAELDHSASERRKCISPRSFSVDLLFESPYDAESIKYEALDQFEHGSLINCEKVSATVRGMVKVSQL